VANLFPESIEQSWDDPGSPESSEDGVSLGRSWRFDFDAGEFVMTPTRKIAQVDGMDAWVMWCQKAIRTPRYRHLIYSHQYGQELDELIGRGYSRAVQESEIQRMVTETLMVDPRTLSVDSFTFSWQEDGCRFSCQIRNVHDEQFTLEGSVS
jgi:hypothetical protein